MFCPSRPCVLWFDKVLFIQFQRIFMLFGLRLAAFWLAFSTKQPRNWCKWRGFEINIHFAAFTNYPLLASKLTPARIDYLLAGMRLVGKKALIMLKFVLKIRHFLLASKRFSKLVGVVYLGFLVIWPNIAALIQLVW